MPSNLKFPSSVEINRVIASAIRAGIEISSIEVHPRKITIHSREEGAPELDEYEIWKMSQGRVSPPVRRSNEKSDAQPNKTKG